MSLSGIAMRLVQTAHAGTANRTQKNKKPQLLEGNCGFCWMLLDFVKRILGGDRGIRTLDTLLRRMLP